MQMNRDIPFTSSWNYTILIGVGLGLIMVFIQVFLQPFDTFLNDSDYKSLKLSGYGITVFMSVLFIHLPEDYLYKKQGQKWYLINEIVVLITGFMFMALFSFLYHSMVFDGMNFNLSNAIDWMIYYALPFTPLFIPLWAYMRYRFSQISIKHEQLSDELLEINGQNAGEKLTITWSDFIFATVDSNYLDIYVLNEQGNTEKHIIRGTLSDLVNQLPKARQVHRSYLINTAHIKELTGNTRKGAAILNHHPEKIPVSPKHFTALRDYLQSRP